MVTYLRDCAQRRMFLLKRSCRVKFAKKYCIQGMSVINLLFLTEINKTHACVSRLRFLYCCGYIDLTFQQIFLLFVVANTSSSLALSYKIWKDEIQHQVTTLAMFQHNQSHKNTIDSTKNTINCTKKHNQLHKKHNQHHKKHNQLRKKARSIAQKHK